MPPPPSCPIPPHTHSFHLYTNTRTGSRNTVRRSAGREAGQHVGPPFRAQIREPGKRRMMMSLLKGEREEASQSFVEPACLRLSLSLSLSPCVYLDCCSRSKGRVEPAGGGERVTCGCSDKSILSLFHSSSSLPPSPHPARLTHNHRRRRKGSRRGMKPSLILYTTPPCPG